MRSPKHVGKLACYAAEDTRRDLACHHEAAECAWYLLTLLITGCSTSRRYILTPLDMKGIIGHQHGPTRNTSTRYKQYNAINLKSKF